VKFKLTNRHTGAILIHRYNGSVVKMITSVYKEHNWLVWKFEEGPPIGWWEPYKHQRQFLDWLGKQLNFTSMDDWYGITCDTLSKYGGKLLSVIFIGTKD